MKHATLSLAILTVLGVGVGTDIVQASSHREAPFITQMPKVDGTDFYMFSSYEPGRSDYVTLVANYLPLQDAYGGPNYFTLDNKALYEIHIDNNGDAREDLSFQFRFKTEQQNQMLTIGDKQIATPLANFGPTVEGISAGLNVVETYSVSVVRGNRRSGGRAAVTNAIDGSTRFTKPVDNIGNKTIADYATYANKHIYDVNIPNCSVPARLFVGQRNEPFFISLGEVFDLINLDPLGARDSKTSILDDANVTALELEIHKSCLTNGSDPVIGAWTTASLRQGRLLRPRPSYSKPAFQGGAWTQVSRLGMPLVNEVVIGLRDKDRFNASKPHKDAQFADYVTNPTLPALIETLFPQAPAPTNFPRLDLVAAFLTGIEGINKPESVSASEMMRLNTAIPPVQKGSQDNLGVIGGDLAGFPNGRRPGDDVVDIALRVVMGVLCTVNAPEVFGCVSSNAPAGSAPLTDGVTGSDQNFDDVFPYLTTPVSGSKLN